MKFLKENIHKINDFLWEIPADTRSDMRVPARIYCTEIMIDQAKRDRSFSQLINVTTLPGIQTHALVMPDVHEGYGFPIGGVCATDLDGGVISPGGIGYDINCGIRLLKTQINIKDFNSQLNQLKKLAHEIYLEIPSGVGKSGNLKLHINQLDQVLKYGCKWAENKGYTGDGDLDKIESNGTLESSDPDSVSERAKSRGRDQLGTLGSGNHFIEINLVKQVFDEEAAKVFGLFKGQIVIQIHTGSRGIGHQVATDYIKTMLGASKKYDFELVDRELAYTPIDSPEGKSYFGAMSASANYAWANRQLITYGIRKAWDRVMGSSGGKLELLYDVAHNIAKIEDHNVSGKIKKVLVHRKGATRAFPAGHSEVPEEFRSVGQPVLIPGSMGTASYVLVGLPQAMQNSFGTTCHGSGRMMSRTAAMKNIIGSELLQELSDRGIIIETPSIKNLAEEAPDAYKDVESVVDVVSDAQLARKVVRLVPLAVIKG